MVTFMKMYYLYLILTFRFTFVYTIHCHMKIDNPNAIPSPLAEVKITLQVTPRHRMHLDLKQVHRVLANENLRVWTIGNLANKENEGDSTDQLKMKHKVMKHLGPFTFYQDPRMNTAAVYFHQRQQFDGIIDIRYLIRGLSIAKIHPGAKTMIQLGESGIIPRSESLDHPPNEVPTSNQDEVNVDEYKIISTYRNHVYDSYPEILVIVSCDMVEKLRQNPVSSDKYVTVVSYVLTLFNGVDMLYSKLVDTNIKLNIAGIMIEPKCGSTTFFQDCYSQPFTDSQNFQTMMNEKCAIEKIRHYVLKDREMVPIESYDMVFLLTTYYPFGILNEKPYMLEGSSSYLPVYEYKKLNIAPTLVALAREDETFRNYVTVAHELAHLMNVRHDDGQAIEDGQCCGHIMKPDGTYRCKGCSSWSVKSRDAFHRFFSSADACGFTNDPRSLYPNGRREMLTADHQCQCYGYKSATTPDEIGVGYCGSFLQCLDENDEVHETVRPLDGTLCGIGRVCWQNVCRSIKESKNREKLPQQSESSPLSDSTNPKIPRAQGA